MQKYVKPSVLITFLMRILGFSLVKFNKHKKLSTGIKTIVKINGKESRQSFQKYYMPLF
jgi:hypothetical protein